MTSQSKSSLAFRLGAVGFAVLGATVGAQALAQSAPGWYAGGNIGRATSDFSAPAPVVPPGIGYSDSGHETAWKLYGGYQFHPNLAVEGGYFDLGRYNYGYTAPGGSGNSRYQGLNLDLVARMPFGDRFAVFGRLGGAYTRARSDFAGANRSESRWGPKAGIGLEYAITPAVALRGEWERYRIHDAFRGKGDVDALTVGVVWHFGAPAATRVVAPAPEPTYVPAPAPAPRMETPPPPPPAPMAPPPPPPPPPAPAPAVRPYRN